MMTSNGTDNQTTELREKLAKYGVEWDERSCPYYFFDTVWKYAKGAYASFTESSDGTTFMILKNVTPEQAVAATLGSRTLTAEQVREAIERHIEFYEGGDYDEQAIADELNAKLGVTIDDDD